MSELIADEVMIQQIAGEPRRVDLSGALLEPTRRRLTSEVAFIGLPGDAGWLGFRHVKKVNDHQVKESDLSLTNALQQSTPDTGRLLRAEVSTFASLEAREFDHNIRVEFAQHTTLGLLVPTEMQEVFPVNSPLRGSSVANYKNYRRFQTSARLVPQ